MGDENDCQKIGTGLIEVGLDATCECLLMLSIAICLRGDEDNTNS